MSDPMNATQWRWFLTLAVGGLSVWWVAYDSRNFWRVQKEDTSNPSVRDRRFGYGMGVVMAIIGLVGTARYNNWI